MFDLPPNLVPVVLNVDVQDRVLTALRLWALLGCPLEDAGHQAMMRQAISFAIKTVLIAAGRTQDPFRRGHIRCDISRFSPRIDRIFPGESLNPLLGAQDEGFSEFRST